MKDMRLAIVEDVPRLKEIWKLCFGDSDSFINFYFTLRFKPDQTTVYEKNGEIVAMLTMIPVQWFVGDKELKGAMLYAIATHPNHQHQGIARSLMNWATDYLRNHQKEFCVLVPAEAHLFSFYEKQDYKVGFNIREVVLSLEDIRALIERSGQDLPVEVRPITPQGYNKIRNRLIHGTAYIAYADEEIAYQQQVSQLSRADIYQLNINGEEGCAAVERLTQDKVLVKELLLPENLIVQGLQTLAETIKAKEYIVRTPVELGRVLGGQIRSFGMYKWTQIVESKIPNKKDEDRREEPGYLGLAFD